MHYRVKDKVASPFGSFKEGQVVDITAEKFPGLPIENWVETGLLIPLEPLKGGDPTLSTQPTSGVVNPDGEGTGNSYGVANEANSTPDSNELKVPQKKKGK